MKKTNSHIILASKSPRRKELLTQAGLTFDIIVSTFDEDAVEIKDQAGYAMHLAKSKAQEVADKHPEQVVIGADTIVIADGEVLNKPQNQAHAREMLNALGGRTHQVITGYAVICKAKNLEHVAYCETDVVFKALSAAEIDWYLSTDEPYDKAGGYAIQGLGSFLVQALNGSYTNVVGLPVCEVLDFLYQHGIIVPKGNGWEVIS